MFKFIGLIGIVLSLLHLTKYVDFNALPDVERKLRASVSSIDIKREIDESIKAGNFDDARMYLEIARDNKYQLDFNQFEKTITEEDTTWRSAKDGTIDFGAGFVTGKGGSAASITGAVASDFTVVGDVRDLSIEVAKIQDDKEPNYVIMGLSSVGIVLTGTTILSLGVTAPEKTGVSLVKVAVKTKATSAKFNKAVTSRLSKAFDYSKLKQGIESGKSIKKSAMDAVNIKALAELTVMTKWVGKIKSNTSVSDALAILKHVDNIKDLKNAHKLSQKFGHKAKGYLKLLGKTALRGAKLLYKAMGFIWGLVSFLASFILMFIGKKKKLIVLRSSDNTPFTLKV